MIDLEKLKPTPHPFRAVLRQHKVTNAMLSNYLGICYAHTCNLINGAYPMSTHLEQKLRVLVNQLEGDTKK